MSMTTNKQGKKTKIAPQCLCHVLFSRSHSKFQIHTVAGGRQASPRCWSIPPAPGRTIASGWTRDCECCGSYVAIYHIHHSVRDWEFTRVDFELPPSHESIKIHFWSEILAYVLSPTPRQIVVSLALFFFFYLWLSF